MDKNCAYFELLMLSTNSSAPAIVQVFAELKDLTDEIASAELVSPTLIVIGKVVALSPFWPHSSKEESCLMEVV